MAVGPAEYTIFWDLMEIWNFWSIVVSVITFGLLVYLLIRFRSEDDYAPVRDSITPGVFPEERDNLTLELSWFILPSILVLYLTFIAWQSMVSVWVDPYEAANEDAFDVTVEAYQWGWNFYYTDDLEVYNSTGTKVNYVTENGKDIVAGASTIDGNLYIPCNELIRFKIIVQNNGDDAPVKHAPFVPEWAMKEDAVPGIETQMAFTALESGTYEFFCAEYCGLQHSKMLAKVHVIDKGDGTCNKV